MSVLSETGVISSPVHPKNETKGDWELWKKHRRRGGTLDFDAYCARARINREKRSKVSRQVIPRYRIPNDDGLRMEPSAVIAKIERKLIAMGISRPS